MDLITIPEDRIGALIGKDGSEKKRIEKQFSVRLKIEGNTIHITGSPIDILRVRDVITAIGRGFAPSRAALLENDDYVLDFIDLSDSTDKERIRLRSRLIGAGGKARKQIETMTEVEISIYGKTVSLIGRGDDVSIAKEAISLLLEGAPHGTVYKFISRKRQELWQQ